MQAKKLLALGVFLSISLGCAGSFATDIQTMDCRVSGCPPKERCQQGPTGYARCEKEPFVAEAEGEEGEEGEEDTKEVADCQSDWHCKPGHICTQLQPSAPGRCQEGCRVGDTSCPVGQSCRGLGGNSSNGAPGRCEAEPNCYVGAGSCPTGEVCGLSGDKLNTLGVCLPEATGKPCHADRDCTFATICMPQGGTLKCTPGERHPESGERVATLKSFYMLQEDPENPQENPAKTILPWRVDQGVPNPYAGHVARTYALVYLLIQGPMAHQDLELKRNQVPTNCERHMCEAEHCAWQCPLVGPWLGTQLEFRLAFGDESSLRHTWTYLLRSTEAVF